MKKIVYTIAFISLLSVVSNAQTPAKKAEPVKAQTVNSDGTISPAVTPATSADNVPQDNKAKKAEEKPAGGTRMAITEKGVPASKTPVENKKTEAPKAEKH